jgi:hypothetical protein
VDKRKSLKHIQARNSCSNPFPFKSTGWNATKNNKNSLTSEIHKPSKNGKLKTTKENINFMK